MSGDGLPGPTDSWVTLGGIARETSRIRLGTMVTSATFRYPGPVGDLGRSGRRNERWPSGTGARRGLVRGRAPGVRHSVPAAGRAVRPAWANNSTSSPGCGPRPTGHTFDYAGKHYTVDGLPRPAQAGAEPRIRRSSSAAAAPSAPRAGREVRRRVQHPVRSLDALTTQYDRVAAAVADAGRAADSLTYSAAFVVCAGRDDADDRAPRRRHRPGHRRAAQQLAAGRHARGDRRPAGPVRRGRGAARLPPVARHARPRSSERTSPAKSSRRLG